MMPTNAAPRILAKTFKHLKECVEHEISIHGPCCDLNHIDVSAITDMSWLFAHSLFDGDISKWDVSNLRSANSMFYGSVFNGDISGWNTKSLGSANSMFLKSQFNGDISNWNTQSLYNAKAMFSTCAFEGDVSRWNVVGLENCERMFADSKSKSDLSAWALGQKCKYIEMVTASFQGEVPRIIDRDGDAKAYSRLFGTHAAMRAYLASKPFSNVHAGLLMALKTKPNWVRTPTFQLAKDVQTLAQNLGLNQSDTRQLITSRCSSLRPHEQMESFAVGDLLPV